MKILVGIPGYGNFSKPFLLNLLGCVHYTSLVRPDIRFGFAAESRTYRWNARETLGEVALGEKGPRIRCDYIWFLDDDTLVRHDTLIKLVEQDKDILSALYFSRSHPTKPQAYKQAREKLPEVKYHPASQYPRRPDKLFEVDGIGFGCVLIKTEALEKMKRPWFMHPGLAAEDFAFSENARQAGFKIWIHSGIKVGHIEEKIEVIDEETFFRQIGEFNGLSTESILEEVEFIPGFQTESLGLLCKLARVSNVIVELGVYHGRALAAMMLANPRADCYGVDIFGEVTYNGVAVKCSKDETHRHLDKIGLSPILYEMTTSEAAEKFKKDEINLLHIDAGHEYEQVRDDIHNWAGKVAVGGFIVFDDYDSKDWPDVKRAVDEWRNGKWTEVAKVGRKIAFRKVG